MGSVREEVFILQGNSAIDGFGQKRRDFYQRVARFFAGQLAFDQVAIDCREWSLFYLCLDSGKHQELKRKAYAKIFSTAKSVSDLTSIFLTPDFINDFYFADRLIKKIRTIKIWGEVVCNFGRSLNRLQYHDLRLRLAGLLFYRYWELKQKQNVCDEEYLSDFFAPGHTFMEELVHYLFEIGEVIDWFNGLKKDRDYRRRNFQVCCTFLDDVLVIPSRKFDGEVYNWLRRMAMKYWPDTIQSQSQYLYCLPAWLRADLLHRLWKNRNKRDGNVVFHCATQTIDPDLRELALKQWIDS